MKKDRTTTEATTKSNASLSWYPMLCCRFFKAWKKNINTILKIYTMLEIKNYCPIDREKVKKRWDEIMNVPNDQWNIKKLDHEINVINDDEYPLTLRTVKLNMLPALIIEIINETKR